MRGLDRQNPRNERCHGAWEDGHSAVTNPLSQFTGAIHVYGGDFFTEPHSEWDLETWEECPYDVENAKRVFLTRKAYGQYPLRKGCTGFVARQPGCWRGKNH
jgi:hypothetical protein